MTIPKNAPKENGLQKLTEDAYIFGYPLVLIRTQQIISTAVARPEGAKAPENQFSHYRSFPDANSKLIVGYNVDTLYSIAQLNLKTEPLILSIPQIKDRFWLFQFVNTWNDVPASISSRTHQGKGGNFALVGPSWQGTLPSDVEEIRLNTNFIVIAGRTFVAGLEDLPAVHKIQDQYRLAPLSQWGKAYVPPKEVPFDSSVDGKTPPDKQVDEMDAVTFFSKMNEWLIDNPAYPADAPILERIKRLGIGVGEKFDLSKFNTDERREIEEGAKAARAEILESTKHTGKLTNGWEIALDLGRYGTKYLYRAAWTRKGVGGNLAEDAIYPVASVDGEGSPFSGQNKYVLHFDADKIPPVNAFWSLTLYGSDFFLSANPLNRFALGDRSPMIRNSDGSLDIYIQNEEVEEDLKENWLPAPAGNFVLALRLYLPKKEVAEGKWEPPAVVKETAREDKFEGFKRTPDQDQEIRPSQNT